uniref:Succinyl-CoA:glutarate-CoA transferase n=2 Tax=Cyprinus carpio carpio TaxID=630221 RepID=A0A9J8B5Q7_CYPCA
MLKNNMTTWCAMQGSCWTLCYYDIRRFGAEVIKVERPGSGDNTRAWGPPFVGEESAYFLSVNRNKKSIAVNFKDPEGTKLVTELAKICDVLVENYLPGKLNEMGLGFEELSKVAPQLIYCSVTGYGQTGPESHKPGYDSIASAVSGMMHITGPEDGDPVRPGVAMTDLATGLYTQGAVMAALLQRQKTGRGLHIDCSLLSSQVACLTHIAANYLNAGIEARRWGTAHGSIVPYQVHTGDNWRVVETVRRHRCPLWPYQQHSAGVRQPSGPAVRFSSFESSNPMPPPVIGQHTVQVLREILGYSDDVINQLLAARIVTQNKVH